MKSKEEIEKAFEDLIAEHKELLNHKPYELLLFKHNPDYFQLISAMSRIEVYIWILELPRPDFRCYEN